jgi:hypothetical protein
MYTSTLIYLVIFWYVTGCFSFLFWYTREYKIKVKNDYLIMAISGSFGLISWYVGYRVHGFKNGYNICGVKLK